MLLPGHRQPCADTVGEGEVDTCSHFRRDLQTAVEWGEGEFDPEGVQSLCLGFFPSFLSQSQQGSMGPNRLEVHLGPGLLEHASCRSESLIPGTAFCCCHCVLPDSFVPHRWPCLLLGRCPISKIAKP